MNSICCRHYAKYLGGRLGKVLGSKRWRTTAIDHEQRFAPSESCRGTRLSRQGMDRSAAERTVGADGFSSTSQQRAVQTSEPVRKRHRKWLRRSCTSHGMSIVAVVMPRRGAAPTAVARRIYPPPACQAGMVARKAKLWRTDRPPKFGFLKRE